MLVWNVADSNENERLDITVTPYVERRALNNNPLVVLTTAKGYGIAHWRFIYLMNLRCEFLIHPANHSVV